MAIAQEALGGNPAVGHDADDSGHEQGYNPLHGVEKTDFFSKTDFAQISPHRGQIGTPDSELEEVHQDKAELDMFHNGSVVYYYSIMVANQCA